MSCYDIVMVEPLMKLRADHDAANQKFQEALISLDKEQIDVALAELQKTLTLIVQYKEENM